MVVRIWSSNGLLPVDLPPISIKKIHLKSLPTKFQPFCAGYIVLKLKDHSHEISFKLSELCCTFPCISVFFSYHIVCDESLFSGSDLRLPVSFAKIYRAVFSVVVKNFCLNWVLVSLVAHLCQDTLSCWKLLSTHWGLVTLSQNTLSRWKLVLDHCRLVNLVCQDALLC